MVNLMLWLTQVYKEGHKRLALSSLRYRFATLSSATILISTPYLIFYDKKCITSIKLERER